MTDSTYRLQLLSKMIIWTFKFCKIVEKHHSFVAVFLLILVVK